MVTQVKINWFLVVILLIASFTLIESKRGFSIGRSRKKISNPNVRRNNNQQPIPDSHAPSNQKPIGWNVDNNKPVQSPVGPPPAYPGMGHNSVPSHGAPPAYSPHVNPPSYSAATGNSYSNIGRIPPRGSPQSSGFPDSTSFHGIGYGHNAYGGPSHTSGLYANNGMGMGGYSGLGTYGSGFGHGSSGSNPFSFGNILTGLAVWNVARGFNSYSRPQHVYIHDNRQTNNEKPLEPSASDISNPTEQEIVVPVVAPSDCETCTEIPAASTVDEAENFVTYHPSLLTYAAHIGYQPDSVHYYGEKSGTEDANIVPESTTYNERESTEFSTEIFVETSTETQN